MRATGNVITTLIILIACVVLGAGVIFFGGSLFAKPTPAPEVAHTPEGNIEGNETTIYTGTNSSDAILWNMTGTVEDGITASGNQTEIRMKYLESQGLPRSAALEVIQKESRERWDTLSDSRSMSFWSPRVEVHYNHTTEGYSCMIRNHFTEEFTGIVTIYKTADKILCDYKPHVVETRFNDTMTVEFAEQYINEALPVIESYNQQGFELITMIESQGQLWTEEPARIFKAILQR